jgi:tetrahydromethanopterin S-methyltransferase subunit G
MHNDSEEIKKLNERIEKLEKTVNDLVTRYYFWMVGGTLLIVGISLALRR